MISISTFATGAATFLRKRGIDISALFAGYPGRVGCYYGTKSGPSYSDILARNREALGPELIFNGDFSAGTSGWIGVSSALSMADGNLRVTNSGAVYGRAQQVLNTSPGKTYLAEYRVAKTTAGSGWLLAGTSPGAMNNALIYFSGRQRIAALFTATAAVTYLSLQNESVANGTNDFAKVSVREIVDWSKLVLFDDANGTVPVFSVFQSSRGRGLLLDASQGLVRGPELVTNGSGLVNTSYWGATSATIAAVDGALAVTGSGSSARAEQTGVVSGVGKWFEVSATIALGSGVTAAQINYAKTSDGSSIASATTNTGGLTRMLVQGVESTAQVKCRVVTGTGTATFANISVRELPGNHMQQPTAAARGELSARYNLLTATDGSDASWAKTGVSANLTETATTGIHELRTNSVALTAGLSYTQMARVYRIGARRYFRLGASGAFGAGGYCVFDLVTGTVTYTSAAVVVGSIMEVSPGVFDCFIRFTPTVSTSATNYLGVNEDATTGTSFAGIAGDGIGFLGADLRLTADAIPSLPAYQRVTSSTDYDDVGFPVYHLEQTDDWAKTRINPSGATKALVMWAGQKMSDAAIGVVFETSENIVYTAGTVALFAPLSTSSPNFAFSSRGSSSPQTKGTVSGLSPSRSCVRCVADVAGDYINIGVNGTLEQTPTTIDQGTGSYTEQDVFFGARAGTSLFANVREFAPPLILFQPTADTGLSASQIAALDKAYAKAAGVTL